MKNFQFQKFVVKLKIFVLTMNGRQIVLSEVTHEREQTDFAAF